MKPRVEITKQCSLCEIGRPGPYGQSVLCVKKGVMAPTDRCCHFRYDPLKREPVLPPKPEHDPSEFEL